MPGLRSDLAHLYRRAGFGASPTELDGAEALGYPATVDALLAPSAFVNREEPPTLVSTVPSGDIETIEERKSRQQLRRSQFRTITNWWLQRMTTSETPLVEKMTLFWHAHFATSIEKVNEAAFMAGQNATMRAIGLRGFEPLVQAVAKDPAMMLWLDSNQNKKGSPNENFARELMELFTIGIGNYSDADVREAARAFTGWRIDRRTGVFSLLGGQADRAPKSVLGKTVTSGEEVITLLSTSPATARFVATKLWSRLGSPVPPDAPVVTDIAAVFTQSSGDIAATLRALFNHPEFRSTTTRQGLIKQPIEYVVSALRAAGVTPNDVELRGPQLLPTLDALNQVPFKPPSVGGWPQNGYWLSTATALSRLKFGQALSQVARLDWLEAASATQRPQVLARQLSLDGWSSSTESSLKTATTPKQQFALAISSPEFVIN